MSPESTPIYRIFLASPGDVDLERRKTWLVVDRLNRLFKILRMKCRYEIYAWEEDTYGDLGPPEQTILKQISLTDCDILVGIFWKRFGAPTQSNDHQGMFFLSGTQQEIETAIKIRQTRYRAFPIIMLFQKTDPIPDLEDEDNLEQYQRLIKYLSLFSQDEAHLGLITKFKGNEYRYKLETQLLSLARQLIDKRPLRHGKSSEGGRSRKDNNSRSGVQKSGLGDDIISPVRKALVNLPRGNGPRVLNFWGPAGMGKTTILENLQREFKNDINKTITLIRCQNVSSSSIDATLTAKIKERSSGVLLILLDDLDKWVALADWEKVEDMVSGLLTRQDILLIVTSQSKFLWGEKGSQLKQEDHRIPALSTAQVHQIASQFKINPEKAYATTQGFPGALGWLSAQKTLTDHEIASRVANLTLRDFKPKERETALLLSLFPFVDQQVIHRLLPKSSIYSINSVLSLISKNGLLFWDSRYSSHRFSSNAIRYLLRRVLLLENPVVYGDIHSQAANLYDREIQSARFKPSVFLSAIYHSACASPKIGEQVSQAILQWVEGNLVCWQEVDWDGINEIWQSGAGDQGLCEEIKDIIGFHTFNEISLLLAGARRAALKGPESEAEGTPEP